MFDVRDMTGVNYENIERYLSGNMSDKERIHFEIELEGNEELAQELHFYLYVNQSISECLYQTVPTRGRASSGNISRKERSGMNRYKGIAVVLLLLGGVGASFFWWSSWKHPVLKDATSIKMAKIADTGTPQSGRYAKISQLFNKGQYTEVLPLLNSALTESPDDLFVLYYRGITFLNLKYLGSARRDLLRVYTEGSPQMYEAAYYIAVSYLEEEDDYKESAQNWLDKIPQDDPIYGKAVELKKKL